MLRCLMMCALAFAAVVVVLVQVLYALRFCILCREQGIAIGPSECVWLNFAAIFAGNFLPSTVGGDAVKVIHLRARGREAGHLPDEQIPPLGFQIHLHAHVRAVQGFSREI